MGINFATHFARRRVSGFINRIFHFFAARHILHSAVYAVETDFTDRFFYARSVFVYVFLFCVQCDISLIIQLSSAANIFSSHRI